MNSENPLSQIVTSLDDDVSLEDYIVPTLLTTGSSRSTVAKDAVEQLLAEYKTSRSALKNLTNIIEVSIENAVKQRSPEGLPAHWCYVPCLPSVRVSGKCLALDFGCSDHYFQVAVCDFVAREGVMVAPELDKFEPLDKQAFLLTRSIRRADMDTFCDFVTSCLRKVLIDNNLMATSADPIFMGIVAGFDCKVKAQTTPTVAVVPFTYKDYHMKGFIGADFVAKFHAAFARANICVKILTVQNDTVSTLVSGVNQVLHMPRSDADCSIGVVSNRCGANISYLETDQDFLDSCSTDNRLLLRSIRGTGYCAVVNTECGMFVGRRHELQSFGNAVERCLSEALEVPIRFECLSSGIWYPDQLRRCLQLLKASGAVGDNLRDCQDLPAATCYELINRCDHWRSRRDLSWSVLADELQPLLDATSLAESDVSLIVEVCMAIIQRSGHALACGIMALARKVYGKAFPGEIVVAYSGTMFKLTQLGPAVVTCLKSLVPADTDVTLVKCDVAYGCAGCAIAVGKQLTWKSAAAS